MTERPTTSSASFFAVTPSFSQREGDPHPGPIPQGRGGIRLNQNKIKHLGLPSGLGPVNYKGRGRNSRTERPIGPGRGPGDGACPVTSMKIGVFLKFWTDYGKACPTFPNPAESP